jgi:Flp pilus assembly pilin Flp
MAERDGARGKLGAWFKKAGASLRREEGQTLLEYALIVGFIGTATVAAMIALGSGIGPAFQVVTNRLGSVVF